MGRSPHCKVEQPRANTLHVKNLTFTKSITKTGKTFIKIFHGTYYIVENGN